MKKSCRKHQFYYAKCATCREDDVQRRMTTCRHFNGIQHPTCEAGVNYRVLVGGDDCGWALHTPCHADSTDVQCNRYATITREEAIRERDEDDTHVADVVARLERGENVPGVITCRREDMEPWIDDDRESDCDTVGEGRGER